ncbi:MAG: small multi-drug export protein [Acidimicrobiia bacterium]|nr:small multi-drug export protein [Acidimicrobiia bacterium]
MRPVLHHPTATLDAPFPRPAICPNPAPSHCLVRPPAGYGPGGLVVIPIPLTGGWTGVLASYVFGAPFRKAFGLIALGVAIAATAISLMVNAGIIIWS